MVRLISALLAAALLREGVAAPAARNEALEQRQFPVPTGKGKGSGIPTGSFPTPTGSFPGFPLPTGSFSGFPGFPTPPADEDLVVVKRAEATPTGKGKGTGRPTGPIPTGKGKGTGRPTGKGPKPTGKGPKPTGGFGAPPQ